MNTQERMNDTRTFRIAVIAVAAVAVLAIAAYLFGTNLRADTSASVAPSPLGSSLTVVREAPAAAPSALGASSLDARGARTNLSAARAASLAALEKSRADFHADQSNSARAAVAPAHFTGLRSLTPAEAAEMGLGNARSASAAEYASRFGVPAASVIRSGGAAPAAVPAADSLASPATLAKSSEEFFIYLQNKNAATAATLAAGSTGQGDFYAGSDSATASSVTIPESEILSVPEYVQKYGLR
jgi:hypothetical protein